MAIRLPTFLKSNCANHDAFPFDFPLSSRVDLSVPVFPNVFYDIAQFYDADPSLSVLRAHLV